MGQIILPEGKFDVFIETGTYRGESLQIAIDSGNFDYFYSCEVEPIYAKIAREKFQENTRVEIFIGTSPDCLHDILSRIANDNGYPGSILFWLDAHFQGGPKTEYDSKYGECPLLEELRVILKYTPHAHILIDDASIFTGEFWTTYPEAKYFNRSEWPNLREIQILLSATHKISIANNIITCIPF